MNKKHICLFLFLILSMEGFTQVDMNAIKNQMYLKNKDKVDCNTKDIDNLSQKICSNLKFQNSDSLMNLAFHKLLNTISNDSLANSIKKSQNTWDKYRSEHCAIIYKSYSDCGGCHLQAIDYLNCLISLTDERLKALTGLAGKIEGK